MLPANGVTPVTTADIDTSTERMTHMSDIFNKAWNIVKASPLEMAIADAYSTAEDYSPSKRRKMLAQMDPIELKDRLDDPRGDLDFRYFDPQAVVESGDDLGEHIDANFSQDDVNDAYEQIMRLREMDKKKKGM
tara:strand:+ start:282 stop:683 length:402 start_codon:yes stop_codon:yes gene_type:complete